MNDASDQALAESVRKSYIDDCKFARAQITKSNKFYFSAVKANSSVPLSFARETGEKRRAIPLEPSQTSLGKTEPFNVNIF